MSATIDVSTDTTPAPARAARWSDAVAEAYFPLHLRFRRPEAFRGRLQTRPLGAVALSRLRSEPVQYERRRAHLSRGREESYLVTLPRAAPVAFRQMGRDVRCAPGGFIVERGDEPYRFLYETRNDLFVLKVARADLAERLTDPDRACARVIDATAGAGALFASMTAEAQSRAAEVGARGAHLMGRHLLDLLALTLEGRDGAERAEATAVRAAHLARARAFIRANLRNAALSPGRVAAACGVSTRYLHDLFRDGGPTVSQHIRRERLEAVRADLAARPETLIADLAYKYGFADQAQLSRHFRTGFGETPVAFRRAAAAEARSRSRG